MNKRGRFWDSAGFGNHCWECDNSTDWQGENGKCTIYGIKVSKYDSPNNICSVGRICHNYTRATKRKPDIESRWHELFGTPERAAETLKRMDVDVFNWCVDDNGNHKNCGACPYEYDYYGCYLPDGFSLLEWLRGDAE